MKLGKLLRLIGLAAALMSLTAAGTASATTLTGPGGTTLEAGTEYEMESEGSMTLHPPIGELSCEKVWWKFDQLNASGATIVQFLITKKTWNCLFTFHTLKAGGVTVHHVTGNNRATVAMSGSEWTVVYLGFHCIFGTNNTKIGTLTGGENATLDIEASIPRIGGSSGVFCGSTAEWTGSFEITSPSVLNID